MWHSENPPTHGTVMLILNSWVNHVNHGRPQMQMYPLRAYRQRFSIRNHQRQKSIGAGHVIRSEAVVVRAWVFNSIHGSGAKGND